MRSRRAGHGPRPRSRRCHRGRTVDQAAALGGLRALAAAAGAARAEAGGEDGGALVGGEAAGLAAAGRGVGKRPFAEPLEVATADRTVALGVILTSDEAVALGHQLLRLAGGPEPYG